MSPNRSWGTASDFTPALIPPVADLNDLQTPGIDTNTSLNVGGSKSCIWDITKQMYSVRRQQENEPMKVYIQTITRHHLAFSGAALKIILAPILCVTSPPVCGSLSSRSMRIMALRE